MEKLTAAGCGAPGEKRTSPRFRSIILVTKKETSPCKSLRQFPSSSLGALTLVTREMQCVVSCVRVVFSLMLVYIPKHGYAKKPLLLH